MSHRVKIYYDLDDWQSLKQIDNFVSAGKVCFMTRPSTPAEIPTQTFPRLSSTAQEGSP